MPTLADMHLQDRWDHLCALDEELLKGGVILSEWCTFIVCDADTAFANGAHLACIVTAVSGIESYLRSEYSNAARERLALLIDRSSIPADLKADLHILRRYRNKWVHVEDPWDDATPLETPERMEDELEQMAIFAVRALRRTIYENPWI